MQQSRSCRCACRSHDVGCGLTLRAHRCCLRVPLEGACTQMQLRGVMVLGAGLAISLKAAIADVPAQHATAPESD